MGISNFATSRHHDRGVVFTQTRACASRSVRVGWRRPLPTVHSLVQSPFREETNAMEVCPGLRRVEAAAPTGRNASHRESSSQGRSSSRIYTSLRVILTSRRVSI